MGRKELWLLVGACFAIAVAADDDGDEFSNNLFTDLTPLLTLFGERVTTQFMSQSTGWYDNIILAMAPLGVLTIMVSAVRVGGPSWFKAIIGRARENRAVAEAELMSSTSHEVCELWNGQSIVRVMGEGPIREFIILSREGDYNDRGKSNAQPACQGQTATRGNGSDSCSVGNGTRCADESAEEGRETYSVDSPTATSRTDGKTLVMDLERAMVEGHLIDCSPSVGEGISRSHTHGQRNLSTSGVRERNKDEETSPYDSTFQSKRAIRDRILRRRVLHGQDEEARPDPDACTVTGRSNVKSSAPDRPSVVSLEDENHPAVIIIRNGSVHTPNLTLNIHNRLGKKELYFVAALGLAVQLGVLVYFGIAAKYLAQVLRKDGKLVADYAFPCTVIGTVLVVAGVLICAHVVESSTLTKRYRPTRGMTARVVWLQKAGTVNDQAFEPFAVYPGDPQEFIMTSQRASRRKIKDLWRSGIVPQEAISEEQPRGRLLQRLLETHFEEAMTITGVMLGICGFIVQFVGLRGMHWSASLTQLGAIGIMTALRAIVRRDLAKRPQSRALLSGHELDWLAMTLGDPWNAPWRDPRGDVGEWDKDGKPWTEGRGWGLQIDTVGVIDDHTDGPTGGTGPEEWTESKRHSDTSLTMPEEPKESLQSDANLATGHVRNQTNQGRALRSDALPIIRIRRDLGELAGWPGPVSAEAISLARAIEVAMDALFDEPKSMGGSFTWSLKVTQPVSGCQTIPFHVKHQNGKWKAYADELEAALSLWLYSVHEQEQSSQRAKEEEAKESLGEEETSRNDDEDREETSGSDDEDGEETSSKDDGDGEGASDDSWLRATGTQEKPSIRLLAPYTQALFRDIWWWMPDGAHMVLPVHISTAIVDRSVIETEFHRAVGFASRPVAESRERLYEVEKDYELSREGLSLAVRSYKPLKTLYAQHMFSVFMWAASKAMQPISRRATVRPAEIGGTTDSSTWQSLVLRDSQLSRLAQDIENTGLGSSEDVFLSIIPPLSTANKLPRPDAVANLAREHARPHEQSGQWRKAAEVYLWLWIEATKPPRQAGIVVKATALLMEFLRAMTDTVKLMKAQRFDPGEIDPLEHLKVKLERLLRDSDLGDTLSALMGLYEVQGRGWANQLVQTTTSLKTENAMLNFTPLHVNAHRGRLYPSTATLVEEHGRDVNERDVLEWTPLHYAAAKPCPKALKDLLRFQPDVNAQDIRGRTPLHYACQHDCLPIVEDLLGGGAEVDMRDTDGKTPLHDAIIHGRGEVAQALIESGADINVADGLGKTPLHQSAYRGSMVLFELLCDANTKSRDHNGRTALHFATLAEKSTTMHLAVVKYLVEVAKLDKNSKDRMSQTPLHHASRNSGAITRYLVKKAGADGHLKDGFGWTPLHHAADSDRPHSAKCLVEAAKADKEAGDRNSQTPLHYASRKGRGTVQYLIEGAKANKEAKDSGGWTPLHHAAVDGTVDVAKYLIEEANAEKDSRDSDNRTPLHHAVTKGREDMTKYLVEVGGADIDAKDRLGLTPLHHAVTAGHDGFVTYLIKAGADREARNNDERTPLHCAVERGSADIVKYLIGLGVDREAKDRNGLTPLLLALSCSNHRQDLLKDLIELGANKEARDNTGATPLHLAIARGEEDSFKYLVAAGASKEAKDDWGWTPLHYAIRKRSPRIVECLLDAGVDVDAEDAAGWTPLHHAANGGLLHIVVAIVKACANMDARDNEGRAPVDVIGPRCEYPRAIERILRLEI